MEQSVAVNRGLLQREEGRGVEFLKVGAPLHHPRVSSWPLRALLEARALGVAAVQKKEDIFECRRLFRKWERN